MGDIEGFHPMCRILIILRYMLIICHHVTLIVFIEFEGYKLKRIDVKLPSGWFSVNLSLALDIHWHQEKANDQQRVNFLM